MSLLRWADRKVRYWLITAFALAKRDELADLLNSDQPRPLAYQPDWLVGWGVMHYQGDMRPGARRFYAACLREWRQRQDLKRPTGEQRALLR